MCASARSPCARAIRPTPTRGAGAAASIRGSYPRECTSGTAATSEQARADFKEAWLVFLANRTEADFGDHRKHRASTAWKYAIWDSGCKLPTQLASGQSRCFCGAVIDIEGMSQHVHVAHMEAP
jgi:hypothetical protein